MIYQDAIQVAKEFVTEDVDAHQHAAIAATATATRELAVAG